MKSMKTPYLTQYCNEIAEWERLDINIDTASESQATQLQDLQLKALEQSGLTLNELTLILACRNYRILKKVRTYALKQIHSS